MSVIKLETTISATNLKKRYGVWDYKSLFGRVSKFSINLNFRTKGTFYSYNHPKYVWFSGQKPITPIFFHPCPGIYRQIWWSRRGNLYSQESWEKRCFYICYWRGIWSPKPPASPAWRTIVDPCDWSWIWGIVQWCYSFSARSLIESYWNNKAI